MKSTPGLGLGSDPLHNDTLLVFVFNVLYQQTSPDAAYVARHVALRSGVSEDKPALTVNRLCGSGFQSIVSGAQVTNIKYLTKKNFVILSEAPVGFCYCQSF